MGRIVQEILVKIKYDVLILRKRIKGDKKKMMGLLLALIYLAFISLGLPDAVLGSAWPVVSKELDVSVASMGVISIIIAAGTIVSSLQCDRMINKIGVHKITAISVAVTAVSMLGFAVSPSYLLLCICAVPYGLGAGGVDAALNNYVAVNYESRHMSWLHCMWGVGATAGPYIMGMALSMQHSYNTAYVVLFGIQAVLSVILFASKPIWKLNDDAKGMEHEKEKRTLSLKEIFSIPGVKQIAMAFFCFCALESTTGMWATSYLVYEKGIDPEIAAGFGALFYLGITIGRGISGFITIKFNDTQMIRGGAAIMAIGVCVLLLPLGNTVALIGIMLIGLGSAPVYPCIIHSTPYNFGVENSQAITGVQMASAYTGILVLPAIFGVIGKSISFAIYPIYIGMILIGMITMYELMLRMVKRGK